MESLILRSAFKETEKIRITIVLKMRDATLFITDFCRRIMLTSVFSGKNKKNKKCKKYIDK